MADAPASLDFFKQKKKVYLFFGVLCLLFVGSILWWWFSIYPYESTNDARIESMEVSISPEQGGRIIQLFVDEGDHVKIGDPLFTLDDQLLQAELEQAKAMIARARDEVVLQKVKTELAWQDFKRAKREYEDGVISSEMMDHVQKELEAARAQLQAMHTQVAVQDAHLKMVETQIAKCSVYAPCEGTIGKRWHFPGDVVVAGQTVFSLFDLKNVWVSANLEETKIKDVHLNDLVKMKVDAYSSLEFEGSVEIIGAGAASQFSLIPPNNASGNFTKVTQRVPIRISLTPPASKEALYLRPGMSVEIKIKAR